MKIGISLYTYGADLHARKMTVRQAIEHAAEIGCDGVEVIGDQHLAGWPNPSPADLLSFRELIESKGLEVSCFSTYLADMVRSDRHLTTDELIHEAQKHIVMASQLGAKICRPIYSAESKDDLLRVIEPCVPLLAKLGVIWAIEVHAPYPPAFFNELIRQIDSPHVKLLPDFSCWQTMGLPTEYSKNDIQSFIDILPYAVYCHGKAHMFDENGEEPGTPYRELLGALKDNDFSGYVVSEYEGWLMGYLDSRTIAKTHVDLLRKYGK